VIRSARWYHSPSSAQQAQNMGRAAALSPVAPVDLEEIVVTETAATIRTDTPRMAVNFRFMGSPST
ncbi:MAG: hypothetical protein WAM70_18575, partial [Pyrinomonadaceae bacterium]